MATIQRAVLSDIPELIRLINGYAAQGIMLPRKEFEMAENIRDFVVAREGSELVGCGALHVMWEDLGEVRTVAVLPDVKGQGVGGAILEALVGEARRRGHAAVVLSAQVQAVGFYRKFGFEAYGPVYEEAGIPHQDMRRRL